MHMYEHKHLEQKTQRSVQHFERLAPHIEREQVRVCGNE